MSFGDMQLVPYAPEGSWSDDLRRVLGAYKHGVGQPLQHATLLQIAGSVEPEIGDSELDQIAQLREALCFAGLHRREFFNFKGYVNAHTFQCIVQNFQRGTIGVGVTARRRDGSTSNFWFDEREVPCPAHVSPHSSLLVDEAIVAALLRRCAAAGDWLRDGIELFNLANTDSPDVRPHTELLLAVASVQRLIGLEKKSDAHELSARFADLLDLAVRSARREGINDRPGLASKEARRVWFEDFYASRGVVAHGRPSGKPRATWSIVEHLLLASYVIPRLVLVRLQEFGDYQLTQTDRDEIAAFDYLLAEPKLFEPEERSNGAQHWPWREALSKAHDAVWHERAVLAFAEALGADGED
ncbi:MAG: hypothetical protein ABUL62_06850 [Myxococcales bacterium]